MSTETPHDTLSERAEIEALLPWYVSGKLEASERARVDRYIEAHPEIDRQLALVREDRDAAIAANEEIRPPDVNTLHRLRESVAARPRKPSLKARLEHWRYGAIAFIDGLAPPQLALAGSIAALLVLVQAAAIGVLMLERTQGPVYQTASGPAERAGDGIEMLIRYSNEATASEINALLKRLHATVVDGPRAGFYRIRVPANNAEDRGRAAASTELQQSGIVTTILPAQ